MGFTMRFLLMYGIALVMVFGGANFCWTGNERLKRMQKKTVPFPREVYLLWILGGLILFGVTLDLP